MNLERENSTTSISLSLVNNIQKSIKKKFMCLFPQQGQGLYLTGYQLSIKFFLINWLEFGLNRIFLGLNGIDFFGFFGFQRSNPKNHKKSIRFNPKLEFGLNRIFLGLNGIDFFGFFGFQRSNPKNHKKSIRFNPKLEFGLNRIFFGLNGIDFFGFFGFQRSNPKNPKKSIPFNPQKIPFNPNSNPVSESHIIV
jgi:hypothetical protein